MTKKRDLKRLVRERQAKTGESYVTARTHVLAQRSEERPAPAFPVVEMVDVTDQATERGMRCQATMTETLAARFQSSAVVDKLREVLSKTKADPQLQRMRDLIFEGNAPGGQTLSPAWRDDLRQFLTRVNAGIGGVSSCGSLLAFTLDGTMVVAQAGMVRAGKAGSLHAQLFLSGGNQLFPSADLLVAAMRFHR